MYKCLLACMYVCMPAWMYACMPACMHVCMYVCHVCMSCMNVCHVCMSCMYICVMYKWLWYVITYHLYSYGRILSHFVLYYIKYFCLLVIFNSVLNVMDNFLIKVIYLYFFESYPLWYFLKKFVKNPISWLAAYWFRIFDCNFAAALPFMLKKKFKLCRKKNKLCSQIFL